MKLPPKKNIFCCSYIVVLQADESPNKLSIHETRNAFFNAALHYKDKNLVHAFLELEERENTEGLKMELQGVTLSRYIQDLYNGGRWTEDETVEHAARGIDIIC